MTCPTLAIQLHLINFRLNLIGTDGNDLCCYLKNFDFLFDGSISEPRPGFLIYCLPSLLNEVHIYLFFFLFLFSQFCLFSLLHYLTITSRSN